MFPIRLDGDWTVIARTVMLVVDQDNLEPGSGSESGIADTTKSSATHAQLGGPGGLPLGRRARSEHPRHQQRDRVAKVGARTDSCCDRAARAADHRHPS